MSGFEVAGVVLGVLPIVISALEEYRAGKGVASCLVKWRGHLDTLIFRLKLQRTLFYLQAMELLREIGVSNITSAVDISEDECIRLLRDAKTSDQVEERLGYLYSICMEIIQRYETCLKTIASKLGHIERLPDAKKDDLRAILEANKSPATGLALKARLTFTIERESLKKLTDEMQDDRLSLKAIIKGMKTQQNYESSEPSRHAQDLATTFKEIQKHAKSIYAAFCNGCTCQCQTLHQVMIHLDDRVQDKTVKPKMRKKMREPMSFMVFFQVKQEIWQKILVHANENKNENKNEGDDSSKLKTGLTRKATYPPPVANQVPSITFNLTSDMTQSQALAKVTDICNIMRQAQDNNEVPALRLQADAFELEDCSSKSPEEYKKYTTLDAFFHETINDEDRRMTPKQQTLLALNIASSILQLQGTRWCEKPWDRSIIRFLTQEIVDPKVELGRALVGNEIDRQFDTASDAATELDTKSVLLELAILLLEIWHHKPLEVWMAKTGTESADTLETRRIAAIKWVEMTSERLPPNHLAAIEGCLAICSGRIRKWDENEFMKQYCENIIKPLRESCKAW